MLKDRSSSLDKVRSFLFGRSMQGRTGDNDENDEGIVKLYYYNY